MNVATHGSSASRYALTTPDQVISAYVYQAPEEYLVDDRFFNLTLNVTKDEFVFFDYKEDKQTGNVWASPVQTYLELLQMDKREKEIAETIKAAILSKYE